MMVRPVVVMDTSGPGAGTSDPQRQTGAGPVSYPVRSTPVPNALLDELMPRLSDTEWRLLCVVVRQTLGWHGPAAGTRKGADWLTGRELQRRTGRSNRAVSLALDALVRQGLVEVLSDRGETLRTPERRRSEGGHHWFRLGTGLAGTPEQEQVGRRESEARGAAPPRPRSSAEGPVETSVSLKTSVKKVHTTKESVYKIRATTPESAKGSGAFVDDMPGPPAATIRTAGNSRRPEEQGAAREAALARLERESAGRTWRWDAGQKHWQKIREDAASGDTPGSSDEADIGGSGPRVIK